MHFTHGETAAFCSNMDEDKRPLVQVGCVSLKIDFFCFALNKGAGRAKKKGPCAGRDTFFLNLPEFKFPCPC